MSDAQIPPSENRCPVCKFPDRNNCFCTLEDAQRFSFIPERVHLRSSKSLTPQEAAEALDAAMEIISTIGTTGVHHVHQKAHKWMETLYPQWL